MDFQKGNTSGVQEDTGANAAIIQSYRPYRQRRKVPSMASISAPAAELASDHTMLRWHWEQISR